MSLQRIVDAHVDSGAVPGLVALVDRGGDVEVVAAGLARREDRAPMARDTVVRVASLTKNVTAVATQVLVGDGVLALDDAVDRWLPEIASPMVLRTPTSDLDDVVPAERPVTVRDLLTSCSGWGFASDFSLPVVARLGERLRPTGALVGAIPGPEDYLAVLAGTPMLAQPGSAFLYDVSLDVLAILLDRVTGGFDTFLAERVLGPLGMTDTGFVVPPTARDRTASLYDGESGALLDAPDGEWATRAPLLSGAGGLVSTLDDWHRFLRMLRGGGSLDGARVLGEGLVRQLMTDQLVPGQERLAQVFLDGQGWGFGGGVDTSVRDPWNVVGRYGWVGGTGTAAYVTPSTGTIAIVLAQSTLGGPTPPTYLFDVLTYAAG